MSKKEVYEVELDGDHCVSVAVWQPAGGRYVCDIKIDSQTESVRLRNVHCDVAETLRDALDAVAKEFEEGYEEE